MNRWLQRAKTTKEIFRIPLTANELTELLTNAYRVEVEIHGRKFIDDGQVPVNAAKLAAVLTDTNGTRFGIFMCGLFGNGKTTMLMALCDVINFLADKNILPSKSGILVINARDVEKYYKSKHFGDYRDLCERDLLAIEDFGKEATEVLDFGNVLSPVVDLLERRYEGRRFTVITTNIEPDKIRAKYGARIADRFNEWFVKIIFKGDTYRRH